MSKRFNLREFQQQLLDRLQEQKSGSAQVSTLGVQVGAEHWLVDMPDISEVMSLPAMTPVPLTKPWYCGVANVRGNLYSIIDFGLYSGGAEISREGQSRVLLLAQKYAFNAGLLVSRVLGLRNSAGWKRVEQDGKTLLQDEHGQLWRKLDVAELLGQADFLHIGV